MEKLHAHIHIDAPVEKVWDTMLEDATYREWTKPFNATSYYEGSWSEGSKILFLGIEEDGSKSGMVSRIKENRLHEFISIEHLGMIKNGVEDTTSDEVGKWAPSYENYTFTKVDDGTDVDVDILIDSEYKTMFEDMWPKALQLLKELAEK